ncbi:cytochrome b561 domain-containing protein [Deinococcus frigens]|uniref:cytochrome b561 domain-containing protein n=1 Tax=Deinococcus frigens TaxID=249403 RepID=UPI00068EA297|nr:cytochrome b561 domain-containing protein [Deinococcus frigens]
MLPEWILLHAGLMLIAWVLVLPAGIVIARFFKVTARQDYPRVVDNRIWFKTHVVMQYAGVICTTLGLGLAWFHTGRLNLGTAHTLFGLGAVALGWLQIVWGVRRGSKGGPTDPAGMRGDHYDMTPHRWVFEWGHRGGGYLALLLALGAAWSGLHLVNAPGWMLAALLVFPLLFAALFWCFSRQRWRVPNSYQAIWGPAHPQPGVRLIVPAPRVGEQGRGKSRHTSSRLGLMLVCALLLLAVWHRRAARTGADAQKS